MLNQFVKICLSSLLIFGAFESFAKMSGSYISLKGGYSYIHDVKDTKSSTTVSAHFKNSFNINAAVGQQLEHFRIEAEAGFTRLEVSKLKQTGQSDNTSNSHAGYIVRGMLNGYFDMNRSGAIIPHMGLGFGFARVNHHTLGTSVKSNAFAYQAMVGIQYAVSYAMNVFVEYRYLGTTKVDFYKVAGVVKNFSHMMQAHAINVGFKFVFA